jgi:acyl-CoA thioesterase-1
LALVVVAALALLAALAACDRPGNSRPASGPTGSGAAQPAAQSAPVAGSVPVIVCLGDSITAGYGLREEQSYPALLQARLKAMGLPHRVVNAGVSGDTSAGGLARMDWLLKQRIDVLLVALGGNDGLRGHLPEDMEKNLAAIVEKGQAAGAQVVLAGMRMPTNYGPDYTREFQAVYPALAKKYHVPLLPFLLEGVAANPTLNQADGIHPTAEGAKIVEANVWKALAPLIGRP